MCRHSDKQTNKQTNKQANKQTDKQKCELYSNCTLLIPGTNLTSPNPLKFPMLEKNAAIYITRACGGRGGEGRGGEGRGGEGRGGEGRGGEGRGG